MLRHLLGIFCLYTLSFSSSLTLLDTKVLDFDAIDNIEFKGVSALAYSEKEGLYALSDFGYLYKLELNVKAKKITSVRLLNTYVLRSKKGKPLKKKKRDSEGMVFSDKGLIISFERRPKVSLYDLKGQKLKNFTLHTDLDDINNYQKKNKALEAVVLHPRFGIITSPEVPLLKEDKDYHILYSKSRKWRFKATTKITAIELLPDNNLLVLERDFSYLQGYSISLKKVSIMGCTTQVCPSETLATFSSSELNLENFEGLTHLRDNLYLMVSDDNNNIFQKCLLTLFEIN